MFATLICPDVTLFKVLKSTSNNSVFYHSIFERNGFITMLIIFLFLKWVFGLSMRAVLIAVGVLIIFVLLAYARRIKRVTNLRSRVREHFGIKGTVLRDFVSTCFCGGCVLCQLHEELEHQKAVDLGLIQPIHLFQHSKINSPGNFPWHIYFSVLKSSLSGHVVIERYSVFVTHSEKFRGVRPLFLGPLLNIVKVAGVARYKMTARNAAPGSL